MPQALAAVSIQDHTVYTLMADERTLRVCKTLEPNPNSTRTTHTNTLVPPLKCPWADPVGCVAFTFKQASKLFHKQSERGPLHQEYLPSSITYFVHALQFSTLPLGRGLFNATENWRNMSAALFDFLSASKTPAGSGNESANRTHEERHATHD
ncbi:unnamed protein product [Leuciscus chuanchicus]